MVDLSSLVWVTKPDHYVLFYHFPTGKSDQLFFQVTLKLSPSVAQVIEVFLNLSLGVAQVVELRHTNGFDNNV